DTLVVKGCPITINGTKLSHDLLMPIPGIPPLRRKQRNPLQLLPASGYLFEAGSGAVANWKFDVTPSGTIDFDTTCDSFLSGRGSNTLILRGYPITIDATHADSDLVGIANLATIPQSPHQLSAFLIPASGYIPQTMNGVFSTPFSVEKDGRITTPSGTEGRYVVTTSAAPNPSTIGQMVTIGAYVRPTDNTRDLPSGLVTFTVDTTLLGEVPLDADGAAQLRTEVLPLGEHDLVITYTGSEAFEPSATTLQHRVI
ncbi:Ig-like domain-containing protein, partial [Streptomyces olivochromogenes]|uniref:Ig-like domain-containing protein n=1 Tax=Streptomyces olivochromogenes TaxID=1963 RepID=UPI0036DD151C